MSRGQDRSAPEYEQGSKKGRCRARSVHHYKEFHAQSSQGQFTAVALSLGLMPFVAGSAGAAPPVGSFLNPNDDGPGNIVSDKLDADGTYHVVVRASDPDAGGGIQSVVIQIEDGDADSDFEIVGPAIRVGTSDTYEFALDLSTVVPATDVDDDPGIIRAVVTTTGVSPETANIDRGGPVPQRHG